MILKIKIINIPIHQLNQYKREAEKIDLKKTCILTN